MSATTADHVLVLNADFNPLKIVDWQQAVLLVLEKKASLVTGYAGRLVRSATSAMDWPAVIRLHKFVKAHNRMRFNRQNVLARDAYECLYCGKRPRTNTGKPDLEELTLYHVIPRAQSKNGFVTSRSGKRLSVTCWENVVTACVICNMQKADRTPEQSGLRLRKEPRVPSPVDILRMSMTKLAIPPEWEDYLPLDSAWRSYWTAELDSD